MYEIICSYESLGNARKSYDRTKVWTLTHESLNVNARKSGHNIFPSGHSGFRVATQPGLFIVNSAQPIFAKPLLKFVDLLF